MTYNRDWFLNYHERVADTKIYVDDDRCHEITIYGDVCINFPDGHVKQIKNFMCVQEINKNLLLVSTITNHDLKVEFYLDKFSCEGYRGSLQSHITMN